MMYDSTFALSISIFGSFFSFYWYLSIYPTFKRVEKSHKIEEIPYSFISSSMTYICLTILYGFSGGGLSILIINLISFCIMIFFTVWYYKIYYHKDDNQYNDTLNKIKILCICYFFIVLIYASNDALSSILKKPISVIQTVTCLILYASPGQKIVRILFTRWK